MAIRILLADDNDQYRAVIRQFLGEEAPDLQVVGEAADGTAAMGQAQVLKPDVVSMDVKMPNVEGVEATYRILSLVPPLKVLALSLYREPALIEAMIDAGAMGYVSKEDAFEDLIPAIRAVVAGKTFFSASLPPPFGMGEDPDGDPDD